MCRMFKIAFLPLIALVVCVISTFVESADPGTATLPETGVPDAIAFFPLTARTSVGRNIISRTDQYIFKGAVNNTARWVEDDIFGYVLDCSAEQYDSIMLDPIPVGNEGPFAVNLWFKSNTSANQGSEYSYLLSATSNTTQYASIGTNRYNSVYVPNSLQVMLPQASSNRSGLVRAIVEDTNDPNNMDTSLDSDGKYKFNTPTAVPDSESLSDGAWHMVTITTHTDATQGFMLYVDGQLAGQLPINNTDTVAGGDPMFVTGGDPMFLTGNMFLCARADADADRFFSGSVANASFFNQALNASSVAALYSYFNASAMAAADASSHVSNVTTINGTLCAFPFPYLGTPRTECVSPSEGASSKYCRDTNGAFLQCGTPDSDSIAAVASPVGSPAIAVSEGEIATSPDPVAANPTDDSPVSSPAIAGALPTAPALQATDAGGNVDGSLTAGQGQGLSKGTIAGIVLGSIAAATLLTTLIAFIVVKTMGSGGHKRLQETPSSKAWVHKSSMDRQVEMTKAADAKDAQNDLFCGPRSSTDFNIKASL